MKLTADMKALKKIEFYCTKQICTGGYLTAYDIAELHRLQRLTRFRYDTTNEKFIPLSKAEIAELK